MGQGQDSGPGMARFRFPGSIWKGANPMEYPGYAPMVAYPIFIQAVIDALPELHRCLITGIFSLETIGNMRGRSNGTRNEW